MVKFLIARPIAVLTSVLALSVLGLIAFFTMPVSLLPDIDIPVITVEINYPNADARTLENAVVKPLRKELMQVAHLKNIESNTYDGAAEITIHFSYSAKIDYTYIEVNEKVDHVTPLLPRDMPRPQVIRKKPSDIPLFYINVVPLTQFLSRHNFTEFTQYITSVVVRRFEQIEEVSTVDVSGIVQNQIVITPYKEKLMALGIMVNDISKAVINENLNLSDLSFREGYFVYTLRFKQSLQTVDDFKNIKIIKNDKIFLLGELAKIVKKPFLDGNMFFHNGKRAVSFAIYKQTNARTALVDKKIKKVTKELSGEVSGIKFERERDQTKLLNYSLNNLQQTLLLGMLLAMGIMFIFYRKPQLPFVLALTIPISLVISFFFLYLAKISINIISLSGLVLSVGLMIDNSIVVIDNINQYRLKGYNSFEASVLGTNEVIRPLISSVLTTIAVFVPLVALSGIAGALFYQQAITIVISLLVSLLASIMVLPVFYRLFSKKSNSWSPSKFSIKMLNLYETSMRYVMRHKVLSGIVFFIFIPVGILLFFNLPKNRFPEMTQTDLLVNINWNEPVTLSENRVRTKNLENVLFDKIDSFSVYVGKKGFLFSDAVNNTVESATVYINFNKHVNINKIKRIVLQFIGKRYPSASLEFARSENIFNAVFDSKEQVLAAKFRQRKNIPVTAEFINEIKDSLTKYNIPGIADYGLNTIYLIVPDLSNLLLYNVDYQNFVSSLKFLFGGVEVTTISSGNNTLSVFVKSNNSTIQKIFSSQTVHNTLGKEIPLKSLAQYKMINRIKKISADKKGEFFQVDFSPYLKNKQADNLVKKVNSTMQNTKISWVGSLINRTLLFREFAFVLMVSIVLLYLILAAQFESVLLPFIILIELLFDIAGALFLLYILNSSLNVMSALGIIVMSGIVINDSIIKIDTIQQEIKKGISLINAIYIGGQRRFFPIIMTSLTTVFALIPLLLYGGMGVALQLPLAITIIGGLTLGTFVSLYFIPVMFYLFMKSKFI